MIPPSIKSSLVLRFPDHKVIAMLNKCILHPVKFSNVQIRLEENMTPSIPQTPPEYDSTRVIERPDGFYWQDKLSDEVYGPFPTLLEAVLDMQIEDDTGYEVGETLEEAEAEIGIADSVDPETGLLAEDLRPHLSDE